MSDIRVSDYKIESLELSPTLFSSEDIYLPLRNLEGSQESLRALLNEDISSDFQDETKEGLCGTAFSPLFVHIRLAQLECPVGCFGEWSREYPDVPAARGTARIREQRPLPQLSGRLPGVRRIQRLQFAALDTDEHSSGEPFFWI
jgi:hypothetical protein